MTGLLLALALAATPASPSCLTPTPRNPATVRAFKKLNPCPATCRTYVRRGSRFVLWAPCGACAVDHVCPLACCGADDVANMQWMDARDNAAKGADCSACEAPR